MLEDGFPDSWASWKPRVPGRGRAPHIAWPSPSPLSPVPLYVSAELNGVGRTHIRAKHCRICHERFASRRTFGQLQGGRREAHTRPSLW